MRRIVLYQGEPGTFTFLVCRLVWHLPSCASATTACAAGAGLGQIGLYRQGYQITPRWPLASRIAPAGQRSRGIGRGASNPRAPSPPETPMLPASVSIGSESPLVVPSLLKRSQREKHLYSTNSPAGRDA